VFRLRSGGRSKRRKKALGETRNGDSMELGSRGYRMKRVYFAHPCFTEEQKKLKEAFLGVLRKSLEKSGLESEFSVIDPFDYTPNVENDPSLKGRVARSIKEVCMRILRESDVVIALVDGEDAGVAFEVGVADTCLIPIVLIAHKMDLSRVNAMLLGAAAAAVDDILRPGRIDFVLDIVLGLAVMERA
jgi:nucleoside 2-deoxyribosyltransferase